MFTTLFLSLLLIGLVIRCYLAYRHTKHIAQHIHQVPSYFSDTITLSSHQRAARYTMTLTQFNVLKMLFDASILVVLTVLGGLQLLQQLAADVFPYLSEDFYRQLLFIALVMLTLYILELPFTLWRQFVIEERFGFNRMTLKLMIVDTIKGGLVATVLLGPLLVVLLWLMQAAGKHWWLWAWGVFVLFNLVALYAYPNFIAPLFNKFTPLDNNELKERIQGLAERCGFSLTSIMVMDGSKRSAHGNAYFTGFGKTKRIVFFDTLINKLSPAEIEAVLAHELGHFHHKHILQRIVLSFTMTLAGFALLGWLSNQVWFYEQLGVDLAMGGADNSALALVLFVLVMPVFSFYFTPISSLWSRKHEFQADAYACQQANNTDLIAALVKLYNDNASTLTPDPWYSAFYDSHPPAMIRIEHLHSQEKTS